MKKILFATTALVATAGIASAQDLGVNLSGSAEMGIFATDDYDVTTGTSSATSGEVSFFTDIDVTFTMSGEADNGLTFGASIDLDESDLPGSAAAFSGRGQGGETIFVSFGGVTVTMGDTDGAYDARIGEMGGPAASLNDDHTIHGGFDHQDGGLNGPIGAFIGLNSTSLDGLFDGQVARVDYSFDAFTGSLSAEIDDTGVSDAVWGVGVSYNGEIAGLNLGVGLGYQSQNGFGNSLGLSVNSTFSNGLTAGLTYAETDYDFATDNQTHWGIGLGYTMGAIAVGVNYGEFNDVYGITGIDQSGWGLAASYDLGGGITANLGYGSSEYSNSITGIPDIDTYSVGLRMSF